jgi:hypothetical protein
MAGIYQIAWIVLPAPTDYFILRDSSGNVWQYYLAAGGALTIRLYSHAQEPTLHLFKRENRRGRCLIPYAPEHFYGIPHRQLQTYLRTIDGVTGLSRIPRSLTGFDPSGGVVYLYPAPGTGVLQATRTHVQGLSFPLFDGFTMNGYTLGERYRFTLGNLLTYNITRLADGFGTENIYFATQGSPLFVGGVNFPRVMARPIDIKSAFDMGSLDGAGFTNSRSIANDIGSLVIENVSGYFDFLAYAYLRGRAVVVREGPIGDNTGMQAIDIYNGVIDTVTKDTQTITIEFTNPSEKFKQLLQQSTFDGVSKNNGTGLVVGKRKTIAYGRPKYWEAELINSTELVYHICDRAVQGSIPDPVSEGYLVTVGGVGQTIVMRDDLSVWVQVPGTTAVDSDPQASAFRLGAPADGVVTFSLLHSIVPVIETPGTILEDVLYNRIGMTAAEVDQASINTLKAGFGESISLLYQGADAVTREECMDDICRPCQAVWGFDPSTGKFYVKALSLLDEPVDTIEENMIAPPGIEILDAGIMPGIIYAKWNWIERDYSDTDILPGTQPHIRARLKTRAGRGAFGGVVDSNFPDAVDPEGELASNTTAGVLSHMGRASALYSEPRDIVRVTRIGLKQYRVGDVILLFYNRYGYTLGKRMILTRVDRNASNGTMGLEMFG